MFLAHVHDDDFQRQFVEADGLLALGALVRHDNLVLRAQALEALLSLTGSKSLDWFQNPPSARLAALHRHMLALAQTAFLGDLMGAFDDLIAGHLFPGGSGLSLQLAAFFLSWLRLFYARDNELRVSRQVISTLLAWSEHQAVPPEEAAFAKKLYDDFRRFPAEQDEPGGRDSGVAVDAELAAAAPGHEDAPRIEILQERDGAPAEAGQTASQAATAAAPALSLRAQGNGLFARGKYVEALAFYARAAEGESDGAALARIRGNSAAAHVELWKREVAEAKRVAASSGSKTAQAAAQAAAECAAGHLASAEAAARDAIAADATYTKAHYRLAQVLAEQGRLDQAREALEQGRALCGQEPGSAEAAPFDALEQRLSFIVGETAERKEELDEVYHAIMSRYSTTAPAPAPAPAPASAPISSPAPVPALGREGGGVIDGRAAQVSVEPRAPSQVAAPAAKGIGGVAGAPRSSGKALLASLRDKSGADFVDAVVALRQGELKAAVGESLDEQLLVRGIHAADAVLPARARDALAVLGDLAELSRFSLVLLFLPQSARDRLASMFAIISSVLRSEAQAVDAVRDKYRSTKWNG